VWFPWELLQRAWASSVSSMGTTTLAVGGTLLYPIVEIVRVYRNSGLEGLKKHWRQGFKHTFFIAVCWWAILFSYHLFFKIPHEISVEAEATRPPTILFSIKLPDFAYLRTPQLARKASSSFVLVSPGVIVNNDSWDFFVIHKGSQKVESIDLMFVDADKLDRLQKTTTPGVVVLPQEYSVFLHIDQMFPKGRGSLFAKQFIWKPFNLEHGHYRADISASTGRFHEDIFVEKVANNWKYAAKVTDTDTHDIRFVCRDNSFPVSVAPEIVAKGKCWPEISQ